MADELINTLKKIKTDYENAITSNGTDGVHSIIRSQSLINNIHEYAKKGLMKAGIDGKNILPPINNSGPELNVKGFLKKKKQDVVVLHPALKNDKKIPILIESPMSGSVTFFIDTILPCLLYFRSFGLNKLPSGWFTMIQL